MSGNNPVNVYFAECREPGCWVLFKSNEEVPSDPKCRLHGHQLATSHFAEGFVTELEAEQGWTLQRPDLRPSGIWGLIGGS